MTKFFARVGCLVTILGSISLFFGTVVYADIRADTTTLSFESELDDFIGRGETKKYDGADGSFFVSRNYHNGVTVQFVQTPESGWFIDFAAPNQGELRVGTYENAARFPFQSSDQPGLSLSGNGRGCNELTGRFHILALEYAPNGDIARFEAQFRQHCEGSTPALLGRIVYVN